MSNSSGEINGGPLADLPGVSGQVLEAYTAVRRASKATVAGDIQSSNVYVSYFAIRRADVEDVLGKDQIQNLLKSGEPLTRAAAAAAAPRVLGDDLTGWVSPLLGDSHPAVVESAFESIASVQPSKSGPILLDALPRLAPGLRVRVIEHLGKIRCRAAIGKLEDLLARRDAVDSPVACRALAAIYGRSFVDGITERLYPDNPVELHTAILECMAEHPAPVHFSRAAQLLKTSRNRQFSIEIIRRLALWSTDGLALAVTFLGGSDAGVAEASQEGLARLLSKTSVLPPGLLQNLSKLSFDKDTKSFSSPAGAVLPDHLEGLDRKLAGMQTARPDAEFWQLFYMALGAEKHFLKPKLAQVASNAWGAAGAKTIEEALSLPPREMGLLKMRLQSRVERQTEQQSAALRLARIIESVGAARMKSPTREIVRHLDTPNLTVQLAAVDTLALIGGMPEAQEIERRLPGAHWMLKRRMAQALARLTRDRPPPSLFDLCADAEPLVRISAVRSLEWNRDDRAYQVLIKSLGDPDERVRSSACACLRIFPGRKEVIALLKDRLSDSDARVRANTVESLEALLASSPAELTGLIQPLLGDPNARVVINTSKALFPADPSRALSVLDSYLRAPDANLRAGALWALGQLRRPDAFLVLHGYSRRETDNYVRTFIDKGRAQMVEHPFHRAAKFLLLDPRLTEGG